MVQLKTGRLVIRDYRGSDLGQYYRLFTDPQVMRFIPETQLDSLESATQRLTAEIAEISSLQRSKYFFAIEKRDTNEFIGEIGFTITGNYLAGKIANLGYLILPQYWHHGYVTEAARIIIAFAFQQCNVHKIMAGCLQVNQASENIMKKCHMKKEGQYKEQFWVAGHWVDSVEYGLLRDEWTGIADNRFIVCLNSPTSIAPGRKISLKPDHISKNGSIHGRRRRATVPHLQ
ncbi:MAG: GNAT family protein [Bacillota bacterium]|jgi:ribosomal-protein-alanine N-acetyltransferase